MFLGEVFCWKQMIQLRQLKLKQLGLTQMLLKIDDPKEIYSK